MLREGLDVYVPMVDDFGIDAVIRKGNNSFIEVQIKARSNDVLLGDGALFAAIRNPEPLPLRPTCAVRMNAHDYIICNATVFFLPHNHRQYPALHLRLMAWAHRPSTRKRL